MPDCLIQPKGNIDNPLKHLRSLVMPGEAMPRECYPTSNAMARQDASQERGRKIKAEKDVDCERHNASSLLYTLAAAAASRSSTPNASVKQEGQSSPVSRCDSNEAYCDGINHGSLTPPPLEKTSRRVDCGIIQPNSKDSDRDMDAYSALQQRIIGSKRDDKNALPRQTNQLHLMESMMQRQRQLYEEYGHSNWMKLQRNDSNCLSKSKAKRYRWCVQKDQENDTTEDNHMTTSTLNPSTSEQALSPNSRKKLQPKRTSTSNGPIHDKLYGTVFSGASKFRCRDCGKSFTTLLDLTVHMSKTGHYRDQNIAEMKGCNDGSNGKFAKPKKRSIMELDEKESAEKVLKCLGCGHSFDSLQDLTVHMIKTKHYEDVPSLRLYSQKNEFCGVPTSNGVSPPTTEDRGIAIANQQLSSGSTSYPIHDSMADSFNLASGYPDPATLGFMGNPAFSNQLATQPNFANMLNMAALRLLGSFPTPYSMQMPFPNAMAGYDMAYAAFAARMFLSSPWLGQLPGINTAGMFPPFFNPTASMQASMMNRSGQRSPLVSDINIPPHSTRSASSSRGVHLSSPEGISTPKGSVRESDDTQINKSQILRCVQCGESFTSLQKMTDHMRETTHFPIAMTPPNDDIRRGSRSSSSAELLVRTSPKDGIPTASPLEQLAKLASGKSLTEMRKNPMTRSARDVGNTQKPNHCSNSPGLSIPHSSQRSPTSVLSNERYIRPNSPQTHNESSLTGSDFIKSLESTIQSAISRVNQPCTSPSSEQSIDYSRSIEPLRGQKSKKQYILDSMLPTGHRVHRKSLPIERVSSRDVAVLNAMESKTKDFPARPSSDGEEYYRRENKSENDFDARESGNSSATSPPLDLSNQFQASRKTSKSTLMQQERCGRNESPTEFVTKQSRPTDEAACQSNARKRWERKQMKSISPSPAKRPRTEDDDTHITRREGKIPSLNQCYMNSGSNPLKEMQKIVNSTDVTMSESHSENHKQLSSLTGQKRKMEAQSFHSSNKSYKSSSVLSDLVQHDDNEQVPTLNPLTQMEHLVNLKIGAASTPDKHIQGKKPNLAKPYVSSSSEPNLPPMNGTNPMSALLNLFQGAGNLKTFTNSSDFTKDSTRQKSNGRTQDEKSTKDCFTNAARLNEKMAEIFSNLIRKEQSNQGSCFTKSIGLPPSTSSLSIIQQIQLQAFFTYHFNKNDGHIPDEDLESLSNECGISVSGIKCWIQETKNTLSEKKRCDFIKLSGLDRLPTFFCTSCTAKSAQGLSARDFLHHLSIHIRDIRMGCSDDGIVMNPNEAKERDGMEMKYKGEVHFKSLKSDDSSPEYSLTAHVTESRVPPTDSPDLDVVAEHSRNRVDVIDESPIKVSG